MSGPVRPPLTVAESDGSPTVRPVKTIALNSTDFTLVDQGGGTVRIDTNAGGTIGGTIADTQVAFGSAADTITGNSRFRYLESSGQLILTGVSDGLAELLIERSSGSSQQIGIRNDSSASPRVIVNVPPNNAKELVLDNQISDTAVTGGTQGFRFQLGNTADTSLSMLTIGTTDSVSYDVVFNEDSLNDYDIRMEGSTNANVFVLKGSTDNIGIGAFPSSSVQRLDVSGDTSDTSTTNPVVRITNELAGQTFTALELSNESDSANSDVTFRMTSKASTDSDFEIKHNSFGSTIFSTNQPNTDTVEAFRIATIANGGFVVNNGMAAYDFTIKSSGNADMFVVDSSDDSIGIGREPLTSAAMVQIDVGNSTRRALDLISDDADAASSPTLRFSRLSASPAVQDAIGNIEFQGADAGGLSTVYAQITSHISAPTSGSETGDMRFKVLVAGTEQEFLRMNNFGVIFNEIGIDQNFKIETVGNTKMFRVDGGLNMVAIGNDPVSGGATLQVPSNTISNYKNVVSSTTSPMTLTNDDLQSQMIVHTLSSALTINLPLDGGVKGQYFQFVSTSGDVTIVPSAVAGDTINGGTASLTRATNNEIYDCVCIASNTWILSNPA